MNDDMDYGFDPENYRVPPEIAAIPKRWKEVLTDHKVHRTHPYIPIELQMLDRWVGVNVDDHQDGIVYTVPMDVETGQGALRFDPSTWCSFEEASQAVKDGRFHHIGFVRQPDDGFTFVWIASGIYSDVQVPEAYVEVDWLARGYTGFLHTCEVDFTPPFRKRDGVEYIIDSDWYVVMTGRKIKISMPGFLKAHADTGNPFQDDWAHRF